MSLHDNQHGMTKIAALGGLEAWARDSTEHVHLDSTNEMLTYSSQHDDLVAFARAIVEYADQKTEPEPAAPTLDNFKPGDRVVVTGDVFAKDGAVPVGSLGVVRRIGGFYASILIDGGGRWSFAPDEIAHSDEPIPRVYTYPEGLYKDPSDGGRVFIRHEDSEGGYEITYLDDDTGTAAPINHGMTDDIVASYTLVAPA